MADPVAGRIAALPIEKMVAAPLMASIKAHEEATKAFARFFQDVCILEYRSVRMMEFLWSRLELDADGNPTGESLKMLLQMPFFAGIPLPSFGVERVEVDFELEINSVEQTKSATDSEVAAKVKYGFGPWGVSVQGKVSHHRESLRKTDTRAKYHFKVEAARQPIPEALSRVIDHMLEGMFPADANVAQKALPAAPADGDGGKKKKT
jgi:hypothetical protein